MKPNSFALSILAGLLFVTGTAAMHAHPADVYAHTIHVDFSQAGLKIKWEIKPGPMLTSFLWNQADADQDGTLSQREADDWGGARAALLTATLDDRPLSLRVDSVHMPDDLKSFQAGEQFITIDLSGPWPQASAGPNTLVLDDGMEPKTSINWFYLSAAENTAFLAPSQQNHILTVGVFQDRTQAGDPANLLTAWDSGATSLSFGQPQDVVTQAARQVVPELGRKTAQEILLELVRAKDVSVSFYVFALVISLALGALHALTPGHGKTVVAAYLVGSRGTARHAIVLGSVVTLTHTGSVFLLGLITLAASRYILSTSIIPWLEIVSGLMIVGLGFYLLWQRMLAWRKSRSRTLPCEGGTRKYSLSPRPSTRGKMTGAVRIQKLPEGMHDHGGRMHSHEIPEAITWRSLITLGVSGGLVPCPDAIAILLVAIAINRVLLGLALIVSFSLGLAVVLILIGLLMVSGSRLFKRMDSFNRFAPLMPVISASIVLLLGFGLTYGALTRLGGGTSSPQTGAGSTSNEARFIYLNDDADQYKQLFIADTKGGSPKKLTSAAKGVVDFALSPDESRVVYVEQTKDLEYALWLIRVDGTQNTRVVECLQAVCSQPVWSPDGSHIVYEYAAMDGSATSLWWLDLATGKSQPVFQEARLPGSNPRWSPDGKWLSYATPDGIRLNQLQSGESRIIPNVLGAAVQWSPDSSSILLRDVIIRNDQFVTQLFLYDLASQTLTRVNANENMENVIAAWSPDGGSIAVVRRDLSIPRGDQIWLMRADGADAHAITHEPAVLHGSLNWSRDGKTILYDLYLLDSFPLQSRLEMIDIASGQTTELEKGGSNPKWVR